MRFLAIPFLILGSLLISASARAVDAFDYHCGDVALLQLKVVQKEVNITEAQRKQMNVAADAHRAKLAAYDKVLRGQKVKDSPQVQEKTLKGYYDELKRNVFAQLNDAQIKRLRELTLQRAGLAALLDKVVAKRVGFTEAETAQYRKTFADGANQAGNVERQALKPILEKYRAMKPKTDAEKKKLQAKMQGEIEAASKKYGPQMQQIQNDTQNKLKAMFKPQYRQNWQSLLGKQFTPKQ